jgi:hypothetical protein
MSRRCGQVELDGHPWFCVWPVLVRKRPHERVQHIGQKAIMAARRGHCVADLLVMDPQLGEVPGQVEPQRHRTPLNGCG